MTAVLRAGNGGRAGQVVGLGASGRAAVRLALARGADHVVAMDSNPATPPLEEHPDLAGFDAARVQTVAGPHCAATLASASLIVLSPGVPVAQPDVAAAIRLGVPALSELAFAAAALPKEVKIAAITGTNGKSTVTTFTGQLLQFAGVRAFVGGNLGQPLSCAALECLAQPPDKVPYQAAVVEVSSYQMELPGDLKPKASKRPRKIHAAVVLNLTPDHLERHSSMEAYGAAKCRVFARQESSDLAIIPQNDVMLRRLSALAGSSGKRAWLGGLPGVQLDSQARRAIVAVPTTGVEARLYLTSLKAIGLHNAHNAGTAALLALGLDVGLCEGDIQAGISALSPPPHRMQLGEGSKTSLLKSSSSIASAG
eukprot:SM000012S25415  [mRNA]  locus=s12:972364:975083:- [translate_table: standard]